MTSMYRSGHVFNIKSHIPLGRGEFVIIPSSIQRDEVLRHNRPHVGRFRLVPSDSKIKPFSKFHHTGRRGLRRYKIYTRVAITNGDMLFLNFGIDRDGDWHPSGMYISKGIDGGYPGATQNIMRRYNVSMERAQELKAARAMGNCGICGKKRKLGIDHNHVTDMVRGLLCNPCNSKLGWYEINLREILNYLSLYE